MSVFTQPTKTLNFTERLVPAFPIPSCPALSHTQATPSICGEVPRPPFRLGLSPLCLALKHLSEGSCTRSFPQVTVASSSSSSCPLQPCGTLRCLPSLPFFHGTQPVGFDCPSVWVTVECWLAGMGKSPQVSFGLGSLPVSFLMPRMTDITNIMC